MTVIKTPFGQRDKILGGSASYFGLSASYFTDVSIIAVVGDDFSQEYIDLYHKHGINTDGLMKAPGETFHWKGHYEENLNEAITEATHLNVFEKFKPKLDDKQKKAKFLFLANIDPDLQQEVLEQVENPKIIAGDTMNFWITGKKDSLTKLLAKLDILIINDGEAKMLSGEDNIIKAGKAIRNMGVKSLLIKRGEFGVMGFYDDDIFSIPAFALESLEDPTGAGDTFAGGFMGYIAKMGELNKEVFRKAAAVGTVMASYNVQSFSVDKLKKPY